ncbi:MAG TPA: metalloregulator ArsR/SmtB family transcription factor [Desulfosalsimonadaceae bacterium]|nr:metalloregulator ArsR/SmtB family transcription factor [Desulfosalsimonadaceae bacterium]
MAEADKAARIFKVLSVETRVRIIELLKERSLCVNALAGALDISPAAVSQHLRVLRDADAVLADKRGYFVHYRVNEKTLAQWNRIAAQVLKMDSANSFTIFGI